MRILIVHTRPLCYFSAEFFLDRLEESFFDAKKEVLRIDLPGDGDDFSILDNIEPGSVDVIFDINSRLPYLRDDKTGEFWLDRMKAPFYNFILDHPLYHHPGLVFPISDYHAIGIDGNHCDFMKEYYPHLKSVSFFPVPGTEPISPIPLEKRRDRILFCGTNVIDGEYPKLIETFGSEYKNMALDLMDAWDPYEEPFEHCLRDYLLENNLGFIDEKGKVHTEGIFSTGDFPELMNLFFPVDRIKRSKTRLRILKELSLEMPLTIIGEGWEDSEIASRAEVIPSMFYSSALELNGKYKYVLDITPGFLRGIHDRSSNGMAAGTVVISNMNGEGYYSDFLPPNPGKEYIKYNGCQVSEIMNALSGKDFHDLYEMAQAGKDYYSKNLTWKDFMDWFQRKLLLT